VTAARRVVWEALAGRERPAGPAEVYDQLRGTGSRIGLTTVYRVLRNLADAGDASYLARWLSRRADSFVQNCGN
jgi:Fe2+ or Zn2+ uptake regulation protein